MRRSSRFARPTIEALEPRYAPAGVDVLTYHNDLSNSGLNAAETQLSPANVRVNSFGKLFGTLLDGQVYAQPLVVTGVNVTGGAQPGTYDLVLVATENDSLYALDANADSAANALLWQRSFLDMSIPGNNTLGASSIVPVPSGDLGTEDLSPIVGITGTPVIDKASGTIYLVTKTKEHIGSTDHYVQRLHALRLADGSDRVTPYLIGDTAPNETNNTNLYVYGSTGDSVTDPYNGTGRPVVQFNAKREHQRAGLSLVNNRVYVVWASHGDNGPYHGWVVAWDVANLATTGLIVSGVFNTSPNGGLAGIWQGAGKLAFETDGSAFYFETGNGPTNHPAQTYDANGFPSDGNYYEALVKVVADPTTGPTHQNKNGWGFQVVDFFIPSNQQALDAADQDFGSVAPLVLPDSAGIAGHPHLLLAAGKEGKIYLVDRDNLGKFNAVNDRVVNAVPDGTGHNTPVHLLEGVLGTPAFFNGKMYVVSGYNSSAKAFVVNANGTLDTTSATSAVFGYLPGSPSISAAGSTGGIVWIPDRSSNVLRAYDAATFATELWNSGQKAGGADALGGGAVKFAVPTVANGRVFVGTANGLVVYGLTPPANAIPAAPTDLSATALSGTSVLLRWSDPTAPPNTANGYTVEISTDNATFTPLTTAPPGATSLTFGGLMTETRYYFRLSGYNGHGESLPSNVATVVTTNETAVIDFSGGFANAATTLTRNGVAAINGSYLELTNRTESQAGSAFASAPVNITRFQTRFTFQISAGTDVADGFTFVLQNTGLTALGAVGGNLGYGPEGQTPGIGRSVAVKFDLFDNDGEGHSSTGLYRNGAAPTATGSIDLLPFDLELRSGHVFQVVMTYDGTTLAVDIADTATGSSATQHYTIAIPATVGGDTAYVGFTGGTGDLTAVQAIQTWTFTPTAPAAPDAPTGLGATPATGTSIRLAWTNQSTNETGFRLDRATDAAFTQNLVAIDVPRAVTTFLDATPGITPALTFYYRLRATNSAGDSAPSNIASTTIPVIPPKPTGAQVTAVGATSLTLTWIDHAGNGPGQDANGNTYTVSGYRITRKIGTGAFVDYATLPPLNAALGSPYSWTDPNVVSGTYYEYHVLCYNTSGNGDFSGSNAVTLPAAPTNVRAAATSQTVTLTWSAVVGAIGYNVYRGNRPGAEAAAPIAALLVTPTFTDTGLRDGFAYYYRVTAINANGSRVPVLPSEGARSSIVGATPQLPVPPAPTRLGAFGTRVNSALPRVSLSWAGSTIARSYNVYRGTVSGRETLLQRGLAAPGFVDAGVVFGTKYYYRVTAVNAFGESAASLGASVMPILRAAVNFTARGGDPATVNNVPYLADTGARYAPKSAGLYYGWNRDNTRNGGDRNSSASPNELYDSLQRMQAPSNANAWWGLRVPIGTYRVHLIAGDPAAIDSVYNVLVSGGAVMANGVQIPIGGVIAASGRPSAARRWVESTVTVKVDRGVLFISNAEGALNNKLCAIEVEQIPGD